MGEKRMGTEASAILPQVPLWQWVQSSLESGPFPRRVRLQVLGGHVRPSRPPTLVLHLDSWGGASRSPNAGLRDGRGQGDLCSLGRLLPGPPEAVQGAGLQGRHHGVERGEVPETKAFLGGEA